MAKPWQHHVCEPNPTVRSGDTTDDLLRTLGIEKNEAISEHSSITYRLADLGKYKRRDWEFQKEWRYWFYMTPIGLQENAWSELEKHAELAKRLEDVNAQPPYNGFFLELSDEALSKMEIVFGPRMTGAEKILARALLNHYNLPNSWRESKLRIR